MDVLNGRKWCPCDALGGFHHPLAVPCGQQQRSSHTDRDTVGQDAFDRTPVRVHQDGWRQVVLLQCPEEEEAAGEIS